MLYSAVQQIIQVLFEFPNTDGTAGQVLQTDGYANLSFSTISAGFTLGTAVSTASGSSVTFTGIPSSAKLIIFMLNGVSTTGEINLLIQIGDSGGLETSSYVSNSTSLGNGGTGEAATATDGFIIRSSNSANLISGNFYLTSFGSNGWVSSHNVRLSSTYQSFGAGTKTLSDTLDRILIKPTSGNFDAGSVNIMYI